MYDWEEKPELNITPLVDIMLVLLAILMLTTPVIVYEEMIRLPDGSKQVKQSGDKGVVIRIDQKRTVYLDDQSFQLDAFPDSFMLYAASLPHRNHKVSIRADERLSYKDVMAVLKTVKAAHFTRIALLTDG